MLIPCRLVTGSTRSLTPLDNIRMTPGRPQIDWHWKCNERSKPIIIHATHIFRNSGSAISSSMDGSPPPLFMRPIWARCKVSRGNISLKATDHVGDSRVRHKSFQSTVSHHLLG